MARNGNHQQTHIRVGRPYLDVIRQETLARGMSSQSEMVRRIISEWCEDRGVPIPLVQNHMRLVGDEKERA